MSKIITEANDEKTNVVDFTRKPELKLLTGGILTGDWLSALPQHTVFIARAKKEHSFAIGEFHVVFKSQGGKVKLALEQGGGLMPTWVDPARFCNHYDLVEIILDGNDVEVEYEPSNRPDQPDGLERPVDDKE